MGDSQMRRDLRPRGREGASRGRGSRFRVIPSAGGSRDLSLATIRAGGRQTDSGTSWRATASRHASCRSLGGTASADGTVLTRPSSPDARRRLGRASGASRAEDQPDREPVRHMVGPLPALRKRRDGRDPPADQREVERRDHDSADDAPRGLATTRQGRCHDRRPTERDRKMHRRGDRKQHPGAPLMPQHHRAGGAAPLQHVLASQQRPHRGGDRRKRRPSQTGSQGVAGESPAKNAAHASIVARPRLLPRGWALDLGPDHALRREAAERTRRRDAGLPPEAVVQSEPSAPACASKRGCGGTLRGAIADLCDERGRCLAHRPTWSQSRVLSRVNLNVPATWPCATSEREPRSDSYARCSSTVIVRSGTQDTLVLTEKCPAKPPGGRWRDEPETSRRVTPGMCKVAPPGLDDTLPYRGTSASGGY
jgi:hypothetical protein